MVVLKPWWLPLIVAAIILPIIGGFALGGPILGLAVGFLVAAALVVVAARLRPGGLIETASSPDLRRHVLVVVNHELDDPAAIERIRREGEFDQPDAEVDVRVVAPAASGTLDRWATDVRRARDEAQRKLVVSVASLGKAHISAEAVVGDQDIVQAVEDELRTFPASEVILVTGPPGDDPQGERAARELIERLQQPLSRIVV